MINASTAVRHPTLYENRLTLVTEVLLTHPTLKATDVDELATKVLHAIDHIPEPIRK